MNYMKNIRFGLIGLGKVSGKHLDAITKGVTGASLGAVCDIDAERAKSIGTKYNVPYYTNFHDMMKSDPKLDVISVLTPSGHHDKYISELASYGKSIIVEKPMALTLDAAERMVKTCAESGISLFVVKQNRFNPAVVKTREALDKGRFGKLVLGTIRIRWCRTQSYYDQDPWRGTWALDGGVLVNQASHHIDLLSWMMGDVESVFAYNATQLVNVEVDDTAVAVLKFTNGALGVIEATTATRPKDLEGSMSILGEKGSVEIGGFAVNKIKSWQFSEKEPHDDEIVAGAQEPESIPGGSHAYYLQDVVDKLSGKATSGYLVDGLVAMKSILLFNAIYESVETGKEVRVTYRPRHVRLGSQKTA